MGKKSVWFMRVRGSYLPKSWQGWALYVPYVAYVISVGVFVYVQHMPLGAALFTLIPNWVAALLIMTWIAERTSGHVR